MAHVTLRVGDNMIESVITRRSVDAMQLKIGEPRAKLPERSA
jgi:molybdopterin-binding protein